jgi:hypothetical protein
MSRTTTTMIKVKYKYWLSSRGDLSKQNKITLDDIDDDCKNNNNVEKGKFKKVHFWRIKFTLDNTAINDHYFDYHLEGMKMQILFFEREHLNLYQSTSFTRSTTTANALPMVNGTT